MKKYVVLFVFVIALAVQGCASKESSQTTTKVTPTNQKATGKAGEKPNQEADVAATDMPSQKKAELVLPVMENNTGKVLIQTVSASKTYPYNSYIITSVNGECVVVDPTVMPKKTVIDLKPAAIAYTHAHPDHTDTNFTKSYQDVPKLTFKDGEIATKDFKITSIKASHKGSEIDGSNYIILFEVDGLRIAHMGDIGQEELTKEQLDALGDIDIAFMQFDNSYSDMSVQNEKGFQLIEQLNPKVIIPTHSSVDADSLLKQKYGQITEVDNVFEISKEDLPENRLSVFRILNNHRYQ